MKNKIKFQEIEIGSKEWDRAVKSSLFYDFYQTELYHSLEVSENEKAILLHGEYNSQTISLPVIIRKIQNSEYFDATSVYGYCGPISSHDFTQLLEEFVQLFQTELISFFERNNIISVFSRLHPLMNQLPFFLNFGKVLEINKTVAIDLKEPVDIQRQGYSRAYKNQINKLARKGYTTRFLELDEIDEFISIYYETMDRVEAKEYYYFKKNYFLKFLQNDDFDSKILIAENELGEITSGAIFTITNKIMQYHLGGTKNKFLADTPIKIVMDHARLYGSELQLDYLHLGGGVGGSDEDSLFRFKSGFSKNFFQFSVWNLITNEEKYRDLVEQNGVKLEDFPNFFPLYRAK